MAAITGRIDHGNLVKAWKNYRLAIEKNVESSVDEFVANGRDMLNAWELEVKKAVGVQLSPSIYLQHRRRPNPRKLFPYRNTGRQQEAVSANIKKKITAAGNFSITGWGEIAVPYAQYTNLGLKQRKNGNVAWVGWVDDIFYSDGGRGSVLMSVSDVFELITAERDIMKRFEK